MRKKRIAIICPGRGSYTRETTNYLQCEKNILSKEIKWMNDERIKSDMPSLTKLDSQKFRARTHMVGVNASPLIYGCSISDFLTIDKNKYDIVSVLGNSMGWYTSLVLSGALTYEDGFHLIQLMGSMMKDDIIGGQMIYPIINDDWVTDEEVCDFVLSEVKNHGAYISIKLGGYIVIGGDVKTLKKLLKIFPAYDNFPLIIPYHAAFHTPLLNTISKSAFELIDSLIFKKPRIPLIDGRGCVWSPYSTNPMELMEYTIGYQVTNTFDFTSSVTVALKEFCPDILVLLGPGNSLGGAVGQILIMNKWLNINSKKDFSKLQKENPFVLSLGIEEQSKIL